MNIKLLKSLSLMGFSLVIAIGMPGCRFEGEVTVPNSENQQGRKITESQSPIRQIDSYMNDPLDPGLENKRVYSVNYRQRVLLEFDALVTRRSLIRTALPISIHVMINSCGVASARSLMLCPMTSRWGRMSTWSHFDTSYGYGGYWAHPGGDFDSSSCIMPVFKSGFDGYRCVANDELRFDLNQWYRAAVSMDKNEYSSHGYYDGLILNQFILIQAGSGYSEILGDGGMGSDAPVLSWYE